MASRRSKSGCPASLAAVCSELSTRRLPGCGVEHSSTDPKAFRISAGASGGKRSASKTQLRFTSTASRNCTTRSSLFSRFCRHHTGGVTSSSIVPIKMYFMKNSLPSKLIESLQHLVGGFHHSRICLVRALCHDHLHEFLDYVHIGLFKVSLFNRA